MPDKFPEINSIEDALEFLGHEIEEIELAVYNTYAEQAQRGWKLD